MTSEIKKDVFAKSICSVVLVIILFFFLSILVRTFTRQVLVKRMDMDNRFTKAVLFDAQNLNDANNLNNANKESREIDWEALYPFPANAEDTVSDVSAWIASKGSGIGKYRDRIRAIEKNVDTYTTDYLIGYKKIVELAHKYEDILRWNYAVAGDYNSVLKFSDGFLYTICERTEVGGIAENTVSFAQYCADKGIDFLYIQAPCKVSKTQDSSISGTVDFSNQNADDLIDRLRKAGVNVYDLRDVIEEEGLHHHSLFYRTDHHWLGETGLWAARHILEYLSRQFGYDVEPALLNEDGFTGVLYPSWFLGSQGKKVTLSVTAPEDFSLLYPLFDTQLHFSIPEIGVDSEGDFSVVYDMDQVEEKDYYNKNPYAAYMYGDSAMARFENELSDDDLRILFIHDSFGDCVLPFVSLAVRYVDSLDLRHFTGSVQSYIEETTPDAVIVLYNPSINSTLFDFQ